MFVNNECSTWYDNVDNFLSEPLLHKLSFFPSKFATKDIYLLYQELHLLFANIPCSSTEHNMTFSKMTTTKKSFNDMQYKNSLGNTQKNRVNQLLTTP